MLLWLCLPRFLFLPHQRSGGGGEGGEEGSLWLLFCLCLSHPSPQWQASVQSTLGQNYAVPKASFFFLPLKDLTEFIFDLI